MKIFVHREDAVPYSRDLTLCTKIQDSSHLATSNAKILWAATTSCTTLMEPYARCLQSYVILLFWNRLVFGHEFILKNEVYFDLNIQYLQSFSVLKHPFQALCERMQVPRKLSLPSLWNYRVSPPKKWPLFWGTVATMGNLRESTRPVR